MKSVFSFFFLMVFFVPLGLKANELSLTYVKSDKELLSSIAQLYAYDIEELSIAKYDIENDGSLEYFVKFDNTCSENSCFYTVLLSSEDGFIEIFRGQKERLSIYEFGPEAPSDLVTSDTERYQWNFDRGSFLPLYTGGVSMYEFFARNENSVIIEAYKSFFASRNISVWDGDLLGDGKPERLVVDYDELNCMKGVLCTGYLFNSLSDKYIGEFIVSPVKPIEIGSGSDVNKIIVQNETGYSIFAYDGTKLYLENRVF